MSIKPTPAWRDLMMALRYADLPITADRAEKLVEEYTREVLKQAADRVRQGADLLPPLDEDTLTWAGNTVEDLLELESIEDLLD